MLEGGEERGEKQEKKAEGVEEGQIMHSCGPNTTYSFILMITGDKTKYLQWSICGLVPDLGSWLKQNHHPEGPGVSGLCKTIAGELVLTSSLKAKCGTRSEDRARVGS